MQILSSFVGILKMKVVSIYIIKAPLKTQGDVIGWFYIIRISENALYPVDQIIHSESDETSLEV